jgi:hypothetical protein
VENPMQDAGRRVGSRSGTSLRWVLVVVLWIVAAGNVQAQTDEIQVYDAEIVAPGKFGLTWHNNFTLKGRTDPSFPGGIATEHTLNGVPELAYGVNDWFEAGVYFPVYSVTGNGDLLFDGAKLRALFVVPHAELRSFFYGVNFELGTNAKHWEPTRTSGEIRPILGGRVGPVDLIVNPIIDTSFQGAGNLEFVPAERFAYNFPRSWSVALEHYADFGKISDFDPRSEQEQTVFAVVDYKSEKIGVEFGVGHGFTSASDPCVIKLLLEYGF